MSQPSLRAQVMSYNFSNYSINKNYDESTISMLKAVIKLLTNSRPSTSRVVLEYGLNWWTNSRHPLWSVLKRNGAVDELSIDRNRALSRHIATLSH